jgi:DNA mismatch repair protein MLH3
MASDLTDDVGRLASKRPAPRRLERHPVYVLDISLPPEDVDAAFDPRKSTIGYGVSFCPLRSQLTLQDASNVKAFLVRVIDDFLRRQGFGPRSMTVSPSASPRKRARKSQTPDQPDPAPEEPLCRRLFPRTISAPEPSSSDSHCRTPLHESSPTWIQDILQVS